ncbi:MAG: hypothetical protein MI723_02455, partial [Caulobacterales bacterium]|nr:hypothetical protein [Caulobacterales bacterium]
MKAVGMMAGALALASAAPAGADREDARGDVMAKELIVLAAPRTGDPYYAEVAEDIFAFHIAFA